MTVENIKRPKAKHTAHVPQPVSVAENPDALLRFDVVMTLVGFGKSTLFKWSRLGLFPAPVRLGARCTRWRAGDVTAWLKKNAPSQGNRP